MGLGFCSCQGCIRATVPVQLKETLAKSSGVSWSSAVRTMLQAYTGAATLSQGFTAPLPAMPTIKTVVIVVTACVRS